MEIHAVVHRRCRGSLEVGKEIWELQHGKVEAIRLEDSLTIPHAIAMGTVIAQHIQGSQPPSEDLLVFHAQLANDPALVRRSHEIQETDQAAHRHELRCYPDGNLAVVTFNEVKDKLLRAELSRASLLAVFCGNRAPTE